MGPKRAEDQAEDRAEDQPTLVKRQALTEFMRQLRPGSRFVISWRINDAAAPRADIDWAVWRGTCLERDEDGWTVEYAEGERQLGVYNLPPKDMIDQGLIVEINSIRMLSVVPSIHSLCIPKRARSPVAPPQAEQLIQKLTESITGNTVVERTTI